MGARPRPHGCSALPKASPHHVSPEAHEALEGRRIPQSPGLRLGESQAGIQGCPGLLNPAGGGAPSESLANLCQALVGRGQAGDTVWSEALRSFRSGGGRKQEHQPRGWSGRPLKGGAEGWVPRGPPRTTARAMGGAMGGVPRWTRTSKGGTSGSAVRSQGGRGRGVELGHCAETASLRPQLTASSQPQPSLPSSRKPSLIPSLEQAACTPPPAPGDS